MNDKVEQNNTQTIDPTSNASRLAKKVAAKAKPKTKKHVAIALLRRAQGASCLELEKRLGWQAHSIRGFLSGTARKLKGFELTTSKSESGQRRYRLVARASS
jgi:hypothetical protein